MLCPSFWLGLSQTLQFHFVLKMEDYMLSWISAYIYLKSCWIFVINRQPIQLSSILLPCHSMYNPTIYTFLKYRCLYAYYSIMTHTHTHTHTHTKASSILHQACKVSPRAWLNTKHIIFNTYLFLVPSAKRSLICTKNFLNWVLSCNACLGELDTFVTWHYNKYYGNLQEK